LLPPDGLEIIETDTAFTVTAKEYMYVFNRLTGMFDQIKIDGREMLSKPMEYNLYRAPTDNDVGINPEWKKFGFDRIIPKMYDTKITKSDTHAVISFTGSLGAAPVKTRVLISGSYTINSVGFLDFDIHVTVLENTPFLARFGLRMFMDEIKTVEYFGRGPHENYIDRHHSTYFGRFKTTPAEMVENYIMPQETGNRHGTVWSAVLDKERFGFLFKNSDGFDFSAIPYSQEQLCAAKHNYELPETDLTVVCLDYMQSGVGTNSCGPWLQEKYQLDAKEFNFKLSIRPLDKVSLPLLSVAKTFYN